MWHGAVGPRMKRGDWREAGVRGALSLQTVLAFVSILVLGGENCLGCETQGQRAPDPVRHGDPGTVRVGWAEIRGPNAPEWKRWGVRRWGYLGSGDRGDFVGSPNRFMGASSACS